MKIVEYDRRYKEKFIEMNTEWIEGCFGYLEKEDIETFQKIEDEIADGAMIYFALVEGNVAAACMAKAMEGETWEICKLASDKKFRGNGAGSGVFKACMDYAAGHGAKKLYIVSNRKLKPALHIYKKFGFQEVRQEDYGYTRGDIAFELVIADK